MTNDLTADKIRTLLKLEPLATCGFVRVTFISEKRIAPGGLPAPFADGPPAGSALYFMVTPDARYFCIASVATSYISLLSR